MICYFLSIRNCVDYLWYDVCTTYILAIAKIDRPVSQDFPHLTTNPLTLKDMRGGGWNHPAGQEIACHFSQDHTMVTKFLDFIHKHPNYKVVKSFFYYLGRFSRNLAETAKKLQFFEIEKRGIVFFSFFSKQKSVILFQISMKIVLSFLLRYITFL